MCTLCAASIIYLQFQALHSVQIKSNVENGSERKIVKIMQQATHSSIPTTTVINYHPSMQQLNVISSPDDKPILFIGVEEEGSKVSVRTPEFEIALSVEEGHVFLFKSR